MLQRIQQYLQLFLYKRVKVVIVDHELTFLWAVTIAPILTLGAIIVLMCVSIGLETSLLESEFQDGPVNKTNHQ